MKSSTQYLIVLLVQIVAVFGTELQLETLGATRAIDLLPEDLKNDFNTLIGDPMNKMDMSDFDDVSDAIAMFTSMTVTLRNEAIRLQAILQTYQTCHERFGKASQKFLSTTKYGVYYISDEKTTWEKARMACQDLGMDLWHIGGPKEYRALLELYYETTTNEGCVFLWSGLNDKDEDQQFDYVSEAGPISGYRNFSHDEPDNMGCTNNLSPALCGAVQTHREMSGSTGSGSTGSGSTGSGSGSGSNGSGSNGSGSNGSGSSGSGSSGSTRSGSGSTSGSGYHHHHLGKLRDCVCCEEFNYVCELPKLCSSIAYPFIKDEF